MRKKTRLPRQIQAPETLVPVWGVRWHGPALGKPAGVKKRVSILLACHDSRLVYWLIVSQVRPFWSLLRSRRQTVSVSDHTIIISPSDCLGNCFPDFLKKTKKVAARETRSRENPRNFSEPRGSMRAARVHTSAEKNGRLPCLVGVLGRVKSPASENSENPTFVAGNGEFLGRWRSTGCSTWHFHAKDYAYE